jgi:hypothetical protein
MAIEIANIVHAAATCLGTSAEYVKRSGFSGVFVRSSAGVYVLTLTEPLGARALGNGFVLIGTSEPRVAQARLDAVDGSTVEIALLDAAGVAADTTFLNVAVMRMPVGVGGDA